MSVGVIVGGDVNLGDITYATTKDEVQGCGYSTTKGEVPGCGYSKTGMWLFKDRDVVIQRLGCGYSKTDMLASRGASTEGLIKPWKLEFHLIIVS